MSSYHMYPYNHMAIKKNKHIGYHVVQDNDQAEN